MFIMNNINLHLLTATKDSCWSLTCGSCRTGDCPRSQLISDKIKTGPGSAPTSARTRRETELLTQVRYKNGNPPRNRKFYFLLKKNFLTKLAKVSTKMFIYFPQKAEKKTMHSSLLYLNFDSLHPQAQVMLSRM